MGVVCGGCRRGLLLQFSVGRCRIWRRRWLLGRVAEGCCSWVLQPAPLLAPLGHKPCRAAGRQHAAGQEGLTAVDFAGCGRDHLKPLSASHHLPEPTSQSLHTGGLACRQLGSFTGFTTPGPCPLHSQRPAGQMPAKACGALPPRVGGVFQVSAWHHGSLALQGKSVCNGKGARAWVHASLCGGRRTTIPSTCTSAGPFQG